MTGLNLEPFLRLLRADLGVWLSLGAIVLVLGLMTWTSWGSRRALRKCLVLSILAHVGLLIYGGGLNSSAAENGDGRGPQSGFNRFKSRPALGRCGPRVVMTPASLPMTRPRSWSSRNLMRR